MPDWRWALLGSALALAFVAAAWIRGRRGADARTVRLMLGAGAAIGGLALILLSSLDLP